LQGQHICLACFDKNEKDSLREVFRHLGATVHTVNTDEQLDQLFHRNDEVSQAISLIHISDDFDYSCVNQTLTKLAPALESTRIVFANSAQNDALPDSLSQELFDGCYSKIYRYSILEPMLHRLHVDEAPSERLLTKADLTDSTQNSGLADSDQDANFAISVLLVEDNPVNQRVATRILEKLGCTVDLAEDGTKALEMFHHKYDVILMDCQMPVMDGFEATRNIRAQEATLGGKNLIIALTANTIEGDKRKCIEAGMDDFIPKPVTMNALQELLSKYFNHQQEQVSNSV
jgi:CheY-like chemotaxis protein